MCTPVPAESRAASPGSRAGSRWRVAAATFIAGLFVGGIVVGLLSSGSSTPSATGGAASSPVPSSSTAPGLAPTPTGARISENDACLRVLNEAQDAYAGINNLASAATGLNASALDDAIRRLQPLQSRLHADLRGCHLVTTSPNDSQTTGPGPSPGQTLLPTSSTG